MSHRIMVVDDSRVVHAEMEKMLKDTDYEIVSFCRSGEEALEKYEAVHPELVTMDIMMPGMDGLETTHRMKEHWPDAAILMVSSLAYDDTISHAHELGTKGFIYKPFDRQRLLKTLARTLET